jgi:signal transduction histidine kinase
VVVVFQDMTHTRQLDRVRQDFLSMVTHDLRSPVSTIKGLLIEALNEAQPGSLVAGHLYAVDEEVDHLTELVGNLLDMSRIEAGANIFEFETCHLADLVPDAVRRAQRSRAGAGREFVIEVPASLPGIYADPAQLGRVLDNLLSNALKYSEGEVRVRSYTDGGGRVVTEVSDFGVGIPPASMDGIFSKFYRVRQGQRRGREGAGLGLAICRAIVEAHRGEIGVRSREREGSTFWFALPAEAPAAAT